MKRLKQELEKRIRKIFKINKYQNIINTIVSRNKRSLLSKIYQKKYSSKDICMRLQRAGIRNGDNIMVHCAYNEMYNYNEDAEKLIDELLALIGNNGTLFMPCYGFDKEYFDVQYSPSRAGFLSEIFRRKDGVIRSAFSHFSVAGYGPAAKSVTEDHINSQYGFDNYSAYYKFSQMENAKVILFGLGRKSIYLTVLHCIDWILKDVMPYYNQLLTKEAIATVIDYDGNTKKIELTLRKNNKLSYKNIRRIYRLMPQETWLHRRISNLDIVVYDPKEALKAGIALAYKGKPIYKMPKAKKKLFLPREKKAVKTDT